MQFHPDPASADAIESVEAIVRHQDQEDRSAGYVRGAIDGASDFVGRPFFVVLLIGLIGLWVIYNLFAYAVGLRSLDKPPFVWLELGLTLIALLLSAVIVATQRREDRLADRRARLTLQLALLSEKKNAKIIALLEELRRDSPALADRVDAESEAMSAPADPGVILGNIDRDTGRPPST